MQATIKLPKYGIELKPGDIIKRYLARTNSYPCFVLTVSSCSRSVEVMTLTTSGLEKRRYWNNELVQLYA